MKKSKYILINYNDYVIDAFIPRIEIFDTDDEAIQELQKGKDMNKFVFEIDLENNLSKLIDQRCL